jgi:hypothetical protein
MYTNGASVMRARTIYDVGPMTEFDDAFTAEYEYSWRWENAGYCSSMLAIEPGCDASTCNYVFDHLGGTRSPGWRDINSNG